MTDCTISLTKSPGLLEEDAQRRISECYRILLGLPKADTKAASADECDDPATLATDYDANPKE
jgi:hypothetical protein